MGVSIQGILAGEPTAHSSCTDGIGWSTSVGGHKLMKVAVLRIAGNIERVVRSVCAPCFLALHPLTRRTNAVNALRRRPRSVPSVHLAID